jgi:hypothetical protein
VFLHLISEEEVSSKTGEFDETVMFDLDQHTFVPKAVFKVMRLGQRGPRELIFQHSATDMKNAMERTSSCLQL